MNEPDLQSEIQRQREERPVITSEKRVAYLESVIKEAAYKLRELNVGHLVATDLEDSLRWTTDPATCAHPYWNSVRDGSSVCRTCGVDTSNMEGMGF